MFLICNSAKTANQVALALRMTAVHKKKTCFQSTGAIVTWLHSNTAIVSGYTVANDLESATQSVELDVPEKYVMQFRDVKRLLRSVSPDHVAIVADQDMTVVSRMVELIRRFCGFRGEISMLDLDSFDADAITSAVSNSALSDPNDLISRYAVEMDRIFNVNFGHQFNALLRQAKERQTKRAFTLCRDKLFLLSRIDKAKTTYQIKAYVSVGSEWAIPISWLPVAKVQNSIQTNEDIEKLEGYLAGNPIKIVSAAPLSSDESYKITEVGLNHCSGVELFERLMNAYLPPSSFIKKPVSLDGELTLERVNHTIKLSLQQHQLATMIDDFHFGRLNLVVFDAGGMRFVSLVSTHYLEQIRGDSKLELSGIEIKKMKRELDLSDLDRGYSAYSTFNKLLELRADGFIKGSLSDLKLSDLALKVLRYTPDDLLKSVSDPQWREAYRSLQNGRLDTSSLKKAEMKNINYVVTRLKQTKGEIIV